MQLPYVLVYVNENLDAVDLERAIQDIEEAHAKTRLRTRDSLTEETQDAVTTTPEGDA